MTKTFLYVVSLCFLLHLCADPLPIPSSSGGIIDRELEQEYGGKAIDLTKPLPEVEIETPQKELDLPSDETVEIRKIELTGNILIANKSLQNIAQKYEGKALSMKDIRNLCKEIQQIYTNQGYFLVRVFPPVQTIKDGILKIEILEVAIGHIQIEGNKRYSTKFIERYFRKFQGTCLCYDSLIKKVLLLNEFPDLKVGVAFKKSSIPGMTDMVVVVQDSLPIHMYADYNDYGSNVTSTNRVGTRVEIGNTAMQGDQLTLVGVVGFPIDALQFVNASYSVPLNANGTELGFSFLFSNFHVNELHPLDLKGNSVIGSIKLTEALQRTKRLRTNVFLSFDYENIRNYELGKLNTEDALRILTAGYTLDYLDSWHGRNYGAMEICCGIPNFLGGLHAVDSFCSRPGAGGRFVFAQAFYKRLQQLPKNCYVYFNFQGQLSFYRLPISEELYVGGFTTVRGYPLAVAVGDSGFFLNLEFRIPPPFPSTKMPWSKKTVGETFQLSSFLDHGEVYVMNDGIAAQSGQVFLTSAGFGLRIFGPYDLNLSFDWGFPLTKEKKNSFSTFYIKADMKFF